MQVLFKLRLEKKMNGYCHIYIAQVGERVEGGEREGEGERGQ